MRSLPRILIFIATCLLAISVSAQVPLAKSELPAAATVVEWDLTSRNLDQPQQLTQESDGRLASVKPKKPDPYGRGFIWSFWAQGAATTMDWASTKRAQDFGAKEGNPLLRNSQGQLSDARYWAINGAALGVPVLFQRRYPKHMNWFRWGYAAVKAAITIHNIKVGNRQRASFCANLPGNDPLRHAKGCQ